MSKVGQIERATQNRIVQLFQQQLKYRYLGNLEKEEDNSNVDETILTAFLTKKGYSSALISKALFEFKKAVTINTSDDLYQANKAVYSILRYGLPVKEEAGQNKETVYLIDWKNASENDFAIAEPLTQSIISIVNYEIEQPIAVPVDASVYMKDDGWINMEVGDKMLRINGTFYVFIPDETEEMNLHKWVKCLLTREFVQINPNFFKRI